MGPDDDKRLATAAALQTKAGAENQAKAFHIYEQLATAGNAKAMGQLANCYLTGQGVERNKENNVKGLELAQRGAKAGDPYSMVLVGMCTSKGVGGLAKDPAEGFRWVERAAATGDASAVCYLGIFYATGAGVETDKAKALQLFEKAGDGGDALAMYNAGAAYATGEGCGRDIGKAISWHSRAADVGKASSMTEIGKIFWTGAGVKKDSRRAVQWFRKAAENGDPGGMGLLTLCLYAGDGVDKNFATAAQWARRGSEARDPGSMYVYAACLLNGEGVKRDEQAGLQWLARSASAGFEPAQRAALEVRKALEARENDGRREQNIRAVVGAVALTAIAAAMLVELHANGPGSLEDSICPRCRGNKVALLEDVGGLSGGKVRKCPVCDGAGHL